MYYKKSLKTKEILYFVYEGVNYPFDEIMKYKAEREKQNENFKENPTYEEILKVIENGEVEEDPTFLPRLKKQKTKELNNIRDKKLKNLKVKFTLSTGEEAEFDADEISQTRLARAISALKDSEKIAWIGADYKVYKLTKEDCLNGLRIAGELQTKLFAKCAELKAKILQAQTEEEVEAVKWED